MRKVKLSEVKLRFDPRPRNANGTLRTKQSRVAYLKTMGYTPAQWVARLDKAKAIY